MIRRILASAALALLASASPAQNLKIVNARVHTPEGEIAKGQISIEGGIIRAVGEKAPDPKGDFDKIDAKGLRAFPGFVSAFSQIGLVEIDMVSSTNDTREGVDPFTPHVRADDAYNPLSDVIPVSRRNGVTAALASPSAGNIIAGQGAVVVLDGGKHGDAVLKAPASLLVTLGEGPKDSFGEKGGPQTRMGISAQLRAKLAKAQEYQQKLQRFADKQAKFADDKAKFPEKLEKWKADTKPDKGDEPKAPEPPDPPSRDLELEPVVAALEGKLPVVFAADRLDDIETALRFARDYKLRAAILGGADAYKIAPMLAEQKVPVILAASSQPDGMANKGTVYQNAKLLHEAGVMIAFRAGDDPHNLRNLPYEAGLASAYGLPWDAAIDAITINPARIFGVAEQIGTLEAGKLGNVILADGDPLQPLTQVKHVVIKGRDLPLKTRQDELAEKFGAQHLPKK